MMESRPGSIVHIIQLTRGGGGGGGGGEGREREKGGGREIGPKQRSCNLSFYKQRP